VPTPLLDNRQLGPDVARPNLLTNGGFEIWQRGNGPFTSSAGMADGWNVNVTPSDTLSVSRTAVAAQIDAGSQVAAAATYVLGTGVGTSAVYQNLHLVAGEYRLQGLTVSLSARIKTSTPNAIRAAINNYIGGDSLINSAFHTGSGNWETLRVTATMDPAATYCQIAFRPAASCTFYLDNVMLVIGPQPADYVQLHPADDLARCMRYYEAIGGVGGAYPSLLGAPASGAGISGALALSWKVNKAVLPTVTKNGTWSVTNCTQPTVDRVSAQGCRLLTSSSASGAFETYAADATCTITVEANP
jgi:hypothetical protein